MKNQESQSRTSESEFKKKKTAQTSENGWAFL